MNTYKVCPSWRDADKWAVKSARGEAYVSLGLWVMQKQANPCLLVHRRSPLSSGVESKQHLESSLVVTVEGSRRLEGEMWSVPSWHVDTKETDTKHSTTHSLNTFLPLNVSRNKAESPYCESCELEIEQVAEVLGQWNWEAAAESLGKSGETGVLLCGSSRYKIKLRDITGTPLCAV